jgi:hypothetical protein
MVTWNEVPLSRIQEFNRTDAEYYKPTYEASFRRVSFCHGEKIARFATVTDGIHASPEITEDGIRYISAKCVKDNEFITDGCINISRNQHEANPRTQLREGDVIITTVGTIGNVAVVDDDITPCNCDRHVGIIRIKEADDFSPFYLSTFLNSKYGQFQSLRESAGNVQLNLYIKNIGHIVVPRFGGAELEIAKLTQAAYLMRKKSKTIYTQAQQLLESELGLDEISSQKPAGYMARFSTVGLSETFFAKRIDSQCFAPDALFYERWLRSHARCDLLGTLIHRTAKGRQQVESPQGNCDYCSIKHISGRELVGVSKCCLGVDTPVAGTNDLLLAITGATIGKIGIVKRYQRLAFSGDLLMLRAKSEINPNYLLLALDHKVGQVQFFRWITGSTNGHLAPRDAGQVLVPRLEESIEEQIAQLVEKSLSKRLESEQLLDQAKARVEKLIEEAVQS